MVRRLRLGYPNGSLYKKPGEATYTVDLSRLKHKTRCASALKGLGVPPSCLSTASSPPALARSRFYGPQISTLPATIQPFVEAYEQSIVFEMTGDNPYLFSQASSWQYGHSSSAWTQLVKGCFQRHAGVACPPKLLRASFCTFLRAADGVDDELLESCAKYASALPPSLCTPMRANDSVERLVAGP